MKKQKCKSKARELNKRLVTGAESFQLVNPRNFGTAHTRNERQHEQRMKSLHSQQNRRLARLEDEMDEVRAHQRMLKEVDETTRDPRTAVQKTTALVDAGDNRDEVGKQIKHDCTDSTAGVSRARETAKYSTITKGKGFAGQNASVLNTSGLAIGKERPKSVNSRMAYNRMIPRDDAQSNLNGFASRIPRQKSGNSGVPGRTCAMGSNGSFLSGLLDIRVKRDATLSRRYNYNLTKADDLASPKQKRRPNTPNRQASVEPQFNSRHPRENNSLNRTRSGKQNTTNLLDASGQSEGRQHAELVTKPNEDASIHGRGIRAMTSRDLTDDATSKKVAGCHGHGKRSVRFQEHGPDKSGTEIGPSSSSGDEGQEESPTEPSEKNWGQTLRKCRYLRKPKGYETPEIPIEAVFQRNVTIK